MMALLLLFREPFASDVIQREIHRFLNYKLKLSNSEKIATILVLLTYSVCTMKFSFGLFSEKIRLNDGMKEKLVSAFFLLVF